MMKVTISEDGYFEIDGEKSQIKAPLKSDNQIPTTSEINDAGIRVVVQMVNTILEILGGVIRINVYLIREEM